MELYLVFRRIAQVLEGKQIKIARSAIGEFITTQEQAGFQMMIARMDRELVELWDAPGGRAVFQDAMSDIICISDLRRMFAEAAAADPP